MIGRVQRVGAGVVLGTVWAAAPAAAQVDLLPDIITRQSDLYDHDIVENGGVRRLRLSNGTPNVGAGKLYLYGGQDLGGGVQEVIQRVFRDDDSWYDRVAGEFIYHPGHNHIHFDNWAEYRLREYLPGGGVGPIIAVGQKVSFCILDLGVYNSSLPGFPSSPEFNSCSTTVQGLSVGWLDIYSKYLADQDIDITGVPPGVYWLESVVDPNDAVLEEDETNNATRITVSIDLPGAEDLYEPNDSVAGVQARQLAAANSPNIGPCAPEFSVQNLTIDETNDEDFFRFYFPGDGESTDFVRIEFAHLDGDLDLAILDDTGFELDSSESSSNNEQILMTGYPPGWYIAHVYAGAAGVTTSYTLTINPSKNSPPSIEVLQPPAGNTEIIHGVDAYSVEWDSSDPETDPTWVTFYLNTTPTLDGNELKDFTTANTPGELGLAQMNTSAHPEGTYYVYCEISDGGSKIGDWSEGTLTLAPPVGCTGDLDDDGDTDVLDFTFFAAAFGNSVPAGTGADLNSDGVVDIFDFSIFAGYFGCHP